jgi:3-deoxy-manno-octulosonate cytidylyltransferase (CMP-KDO synthetase)
MQSNNPVIHVIIPARFGSTRLPGKPLVDLAGKALVVRVYEAVRNALAGVDIAVAIDDDRIVNVLAANDIPYVVTLPTHESGTDRAAEVARLLSWNPADIILNVQGDEPLIPAELLNSFASFCRSRTAMSMATIAVPLEEQSQIQDPNIVKVTVDADNRAIAFSRSPIPFARDLPIGEWCVENYLRHVGIYAYRNEVLQRLTATPPCMLEKVEKLEQLRAQWMGIPIHVMRWGVAPPHGVDTPEDAERVARIFGK